MGAPPATAADVTWSTHAEGLVSVHAADGTFGSGQAASVASEAARTLDELATLLDPSRTQRSQPVDILVLDLRMPGKSGLDVLREVTTDAPSCRVVLLTAALRDAAVSEIMQAGAKGIVLKESSPEDLIDCVRRVHRGHVWIDRGLLARTFDRGGKNGEAGETVSLTPREREIIRMVAQGLRNREIGQRLFISEGTVKIHLHNVYDKLGLDGRLELLLYAQENALI